MYILSLLSVITLYFTFITLLVPYGVQCYFAVLWGMDNSDAIFLHFKFVDALQSKPQHVFLPNIWNMFVTRKTWS